MRSFVVACLLCLLLAGCEVEDGGSEERPEAAVGSGQTCVARLDAALTPAYLESQGIASLSALDRAHWVRKTCSELPADFPLDDAAELAAGEIVQSLL